MPEGAFGLEYLLRSRGLATETSSLTFENEVNSSHSMWHHNCPMDISYGSLAEIRRVNLTIRATISYISDVFLFGNKMVNRKMKATGNCRIICLEPSERCKILQQLGRTSYGVNLLYHGISDGDP
jgi:hypothetical protein